MKTRCRSYRVANTCSDNRYEPLCKARACVSEDHFKLKGKMLPSNDQKFEKLDPFHRPVLSKQKTSAEIISEARTALRAVRTQRPFTPREDQRKLFGPASSRTPENRPPSSFRSVSDGASFTSIVTLSCPWHQARVYEHTLEAEVLHKLTLYTLSSTSLHASNFELTDSRPISGTRLSPLQLVSTCCYYQRCDMNLAANPRSQH
ncbi:hypothetical protein STEG23_029799 [Scotinomys teguina]